MSSFESLIISNFFSFHRPVIYYKKYKNKKMTDDRTIIDDPWAHLLKMKEAANAKYCMHVKSVLLAVMGCILDSHAKNKVLTLNYGDPLPIILYTTTDGKIKAEVKPGMPSPQTDLGDHNQKQRFKCVDLQNLYSVLQYASKKSGLNCRDLDQLANELAMRNEMGKCDENSYAKWLKIFLEYANRLQDELKSFYDHNIGPIARRTADHLGRMGGRAIKQARSGKLQNGLMELRDRVFENKPRFKGAFEGDVWRDYKDGVARFGKEGLQNIKDRLPKFGGNFSFRERFGGPSSFRERFGGPSSFRERFNLKRSPNPKRRPGHLWSYVPELASGADPGKPVGDTELTTVPPAFLNRTIGQSELQRRLQARQWDQPLQ